MNRPIPKRVTDEAKRIYFGRCDSVSKLAEQFTEDEVLDLLSRAILAAEQREREACAAIIHLAGDQCEEERNRHPVNSKLRISNHAAMTLARDLEAAIRSRGDK